MQKAFEQMNIKLHNVLTDISGKSGQAIINAILNGELDPEVLISYVDPKVKASKEEIIKSLRGIWREEHLFELKQAYELYVIFKEKIEHCDLQIEKTLHKIEQVHDYSNDVTEIKRRVYSKNRLHFNGTQYLYGILGIDITKVFGISELTAIEIISETGINMSKWKTKKHFASWLNLAPNNRISGGKLLKPKKSKRRNKAGQAFLMAAFAVQRSDNWLGQYYRRMKAKNGPLVATKATARKLALIFYEMIKNRKEFNPLPIESYLKTYTKNRIQYIEKQASLLGFKLLPASDVS